MSVLLELAGLAGFLVVVVLFCRFVFRTLARWGGWDDLAQRYPAKKEFDGPTKRWQSGQFDTFVLHKGTLVLGADRDGLHVSVIPLFSYAHPPLHIPWAELASRERDGLFGKEVVLALRHAPYVQVYLRPPVAQQLAAWSEGGLTVSGDSAKE